MASNDAEWDKLVENANLRQQEYYEMLPLLTKYDKIEYKYLWQNIGFAIFGPPMEDEGGSVKAKDSCTITDDHDVMQAVQYVPEAKKVIDHVYGQVVKFGEGFVEKDKIYYGQIYNMTFRTKNASVEKDKSKDGGQNKELDAEIQQIPVFKILRQIKYGTEIWFIDARGRVYKSWLDYLTKNTLPKCTMVVPKDGIYEPNNNYEITEEYSKVWTVVLESPACKRVHKVLNVVDGVSNVTGVVGLGLCVASLFTPAAPVTLGAAALSGVNGLWMFGRSAHHLIDRNSHEESISITNREALCSWLAVGGSTFGVVNTGGTVVLTKLVKSGYSINTVARCAYNVILIGNLGINCVGVAYQAFNLYQTYQEEKSVRLIDVASVAAHMLFIGNTVINLQFAGTLIETTQGKVLDDYTATRRSKNQRKQFNRAKRNAAANNPDKMSENAEVIRYINRKDELNIKLNSGNISTLKKSVYFSTGKVVINGITMLDPMKFVDMLTKSDKKSFAAQNLNNNHSSPSEDDSIINSRFVALKDLLIGLLENLASKYDKEKKRFPCAKEFYRTLNDVKFMVNGASVFLLIFKIAIKLLAPLTIKYVEKSVHFVWNYVKESIRSTCSETFSIFDEDVQKMIDSIILTLFENMEDTGRSLKSAVEKYISQNF